MKSEVRPPHHEVKVTLMNRDWTSISVLGIALLQNRRLSSRPSSSKGKGEKADQVEEIQRGVSGGDQLGID